MQDIYAPMHKALALLNLEQSKREKDRQPLYEAYLELCAKTNEWPK